MGDFGIAKVLSHTRECAQTTIGTPYYLSPEIIHKAPYSFASDIWSLGILLYEMTALQIPFQSDNILGLCNSIVNDPHPPLDCSSSLTYLLDWCLQKNEHDRPSIHQILHVPILADRISSFIEHHEKSIDQVPFKERQIINLKEQAPIFKEPSKIQNDADARNLAIYAQIQSKHKAKVKTAKSQYSYAQILQQNLNKQGRYPIENKKKIKGNAEVLPNKKPLVRIEQQERIIQKVEWAQKKREKSQVEKEREYQRINMKKDIQRRRNKSQLPEDKREPSQQQGLNFLAQQIQEQQHDQLIERQNSLQHLPVHRYNNFFKEGVEQDIQQPSQQVRRSREIDDIIYNGAEEEQDQEQKEDKASQIASLKSILSNIFGVESFQKAHRMLSSLVQCGRSLEQIEQEHSSSQFRGLFPFLERGQRCIPLLFGLVALEQ